MSVQLLASDDSGTTVKLSLQILTFMLAPNIRTGWLSRFTDVPAGSGCSGIVLVRSYSPSMFASNDSIVLDAPASRDPLFRCT